MVELALRNEIDVCLSIAAKATKRLVVEELFTDYLGLYFAVGTGFEDHSSLALFEETVQPWREAIAAALPVMRLADRLPIRTDSFEVVHALAVEGVAIGILPARVAATSVSKGLLREQPLAALRRQTCHSISLCYLRVREHDVAIRVFCDEIKAATF